MNSLSWFKIAETGLENGVWAVDTLYEEGTGKWPATIPTALEDGDYLLRGEILALHSASSYPGAQCKSKFKSSKFGRRKLMENT